MSNKSKCPICGWSAYIGLNKVECNNPKCSNFNPSISIDDAFYKMKLWKDIEELTKALEAGKYNTAPSDSTKVLKEIYLYVKDKLIKAIDAESN